MRRLVLLSCIFVLSILSCQLKAGTTPSTLFDNTREVIYGGTYGSTYYGAKSTSLADIDSDGDMDAAVTWYYSSTSYVFWMENDGSGSFTLREIETGSDDVPVVHAVDIDHDSFVDILVGTEGKLLWYKNDGNQVFSRHILHEDSDIVVNSIYVADIDADGDVDVLACGTNLAFFLLNTNTDADDDGLIDFEYNIVGTVIACRTIHAASISNNPNGLDIVIASGSEKIVWFEHGDWGSISHEGYHLSHHANGVTSAFPADVDGDGDIDIFCSDNDDNQLWWLENDIQSSYTAWPEHNFYTYRDASYITAGDIDGDGDMDVVIANSWRNLVYW